MGLEILTAHQRVLLDRIRDAPGITDRFTLSGGTALAAFYYNHRDSEDEWRSFFIAAARGLGPSVLAA